ncbi:MAG: hypothetical protein HQ534_02495 [Armatimonadetes bacterium]|nr:hypothetical protein [Armatimonadota bacterium]
MVSKLYSINKSRTGYAYQYKHILLQLLKFIKSGRLTEAHIDFPFTCSQHVNLSLDAKFVFTDKTYIYEIKSGDDFKEDKVEELKHVLRNLYFYEQAYNTKCDKFIIIAPDIRSRILEHWDNFQFIQENKKINSQGEKQAHVRDRVYLQFGFDELSVEKKVFINFIKDLKFILGLKYTRDDELDTLSDLEDQIVSEIDNFCQIFRVVDSAIAIPSWSIAVELLETLSKCSESNKESLRDICNKLADCLSRRKLLCDAKFPDGNRDNILDNIKKDLSKGLIEITKISFLRENIDKGYNHGKTRTV